MDVSRFPTPGSGFNYLEKMINRSRYTPPKVRFWARVEKKGPIVSYVGTRCWIWTGYSPGKQGYGSLKVDGVAIKSHRYSWILHKGPIPKGMFVLHKCDTTRCVNPDHLFLGTHQDNVDDRSIKGRAAFGDRNGHSTKPGCEKRGEDHGSSVLTEKQVRSIRKEFVPRKYREAKRVMRKYNISYATLYRIVRNITWRHCK